MPHRYRCLFVIAGLLTGAPAASGQVPFETVGTRALGMGGAFVAVADDASATYWNPAGLPGLGFFDATFEIGRETDADGAGRAADTSGWRAESTRLAIATPVLAFSYERLRLAEARSPGSAASGSEPRPLELTLPGRVLHAQNFGVTLVQSLSDGVVVGSTLRLLRAGAAPAPVDAGADIGEALRRIAQMDASSSHHFDADVGVLASIGRFRLGLVVRNLTSPEIDFAGDVLEIERQARAGVSFGGGPARGQRPWTIAVDGDLTTIALPDGRRRSLALGGERWWSERRLGLRAGGRLQTVGDVRPAVSGGLSVALRTGLLIEAHATRGEDARDRGWGVGARLTF